MTMIRIFPIKISYTSTTMSRRIFLTITLFWLATAVHAQQGLHINGLLSGKIISQSEMAAIGGVEVRVRGRALSKYNLNFYHSYHFVATAGQKAKVDELITKDRLKAISSEVTTKGRAVTTILTMPAEGANNRFICYIVRPKGKAAELTVVYMEGRVRNISELRKLIK